MLRQMMTHGVTNYSVVDAVDGLKLDVDSLIREGQLIVNSYTGRYLTAGETGCLMSHIKVWRMIRKMREPNAIILEDDVELAPNACQVLTQAVAELPLDWDIVHLHSTIEVGAGTRIDLGRARISNHIWRGYEEGGGTVAYALSNRNGLVDDLLKWSSPLEFAADGYTNWPTSTWVKKTYNGYIISPFICTHREGPSAIWHRNKPGLAVRVSHLIRHVIKGVLPSSWTERIRKWLH